MASDGNVVISGNIGREPESRYTPAGKQILSFSVALWTGKDKDSGENRKSYWVNVSLYDEVAAEYADQLHKGTRVTVIGWAQEPRNYESKSLGRVVDAPLSINGKNISIVGERTDDVPF